MGAVYVAELDDIRSAAAADNMCWWTVVRHYPGDGAVATAQPVPFAARFWAARAAAARDEGSGRQWTARARVATIRSAERRRRAELRGRVASGRSVHNVPQLREIAAFKQGEFECRDSTEVARLVAEHFRRRWGGHRPEDRVAALDVALAMDGSPPAIAEEVIGEVASSLRRQAIIDATGLCPAAAALAAAAAPQATEAAFASLISSMAVMSEVVIKARALGKRTDTPTDGEIRVILPLTKDMSILDVVRAQRVHAHLDSLPPLPRSVLEAGRPGASATDLALTAKLVIEKALDRRSQGAVAQADIRQFDDQVPVTGFVKELAEQGLPQELPAAVVRHQLLPAVELRVGLSTAVVRGRASGSLTRSRVPGALGRAVVRSVLAARDASGAEALLDWFAAQLLDRWGCDLAAASIEVLVPAPVAPSRHRHVMDMKCLRYWLSSAGSYSRCWRSARNAARAAAPVGTRILRGAHVAMAVKDRYLETCVFPILAYRAPTWPPTDVLRAEADRLHRWCVAQAARAVPWLGEAPGVFARRRARAVARLVRPDREWGRRLAALARAAHAELRSPMCARWPAAGSVRTLNGLGSRGLPAGPRRHTRAAWAFGGQ